jgi:hypothetical protein
MAILNKTGITNGSTIQAEHVTRTIDALTGVSTDTIVATGSFTGSFTGPLTGTASFATSASRAVSSSFATSASRAVSSSFAVTASYALNATAGSTSGLQSLQFTHDSWVTASTTPVYYGNYPAAPIGSIGRVGVISPYTGTLVSASISGHMKNPGGGAKLSLWVVRGVAGAVSMSLDGGGVDFIDTDEYFNGFTYTLSPMAGTAFTASFGDTLSIKLQSNGEVNGLNAYTTVTLLFRP